MERAHQARETLDLGFSMEELEEELAAELPDRDLLISVGLLGIPIVSVTGINVNIS